MKSIYSEFNIRCPITLLFSFLIISNSYLFGQVSIQKDGSNAAALHSIGLTGFGVNVGLLSSRNVNAAHLAFNDANGVHVFNFDYSGYGVDYTGGSVPGHDTWVAGIIASRGWTGCAAAVGVAPGCNIYSARVNSDYAADFTGAFEEFINNYNCRVFAIPLQFLYTPNGSDNLSKMVDYYAYEYNVVMPLASGNNFTMPTIFGDAYNGITTGALIDETSGRYDKIGTMSNPGPTVDGRNKPDICSPGSSQIAPSIGSATSAYTTVKDGATSFSLPHAAGIIALLLQYADSTPAPDDDKNVVIKAVIVNSTFPNIRDKSGSYTSPATNVWNAQRGYGKIDALKAYQTLSAGRISKSSSVSQQLGWAYDSLDASGTHTYKIYGNENERLLATITWNRAITKSANIFSEDTPKFNIDITVKDPNNDIVYSKTGTPNNLIKIDLPLVSTGEYQVILTNTTAKTRPYALAFEFLEPLAGDFNTDFVVDRKDMAFLTGDWLKKEEGLVTDVIPDASIDNLDYMAITRNWMGKNSRYYTP